MNDLIAFLTSVAHFAFLKLTIGTLGQGEKYVQS